MKCKTAFVLAMLLALRDSPAHAATPENPKLKAVHEKIRQAEEAKDQKAEIQWRRKAVALGDLDGANYLAKILQNGWKGEKNPREAFALFQSAAKKGHRDSQDKMGDLYYNTYGEEKFAAELGIALDCDQAMHWYQLAADQGSGWSAHSLGEIYEYGCAGKYLDHAKAQFWYQRAVSSQTISSWQDDLNRIQKKIADHAEPERGSVHDPLLRMYQNKVLEAQQAQDHVGAARWTRKAADLGSPSYESMLAMYLESGIGEKKDLKEAYEHYRRLAERGHASSQVKMGALYDAPTKEQRSQLGVSQDCDAALKWYQQAADHGMALNLAEFYEYGCGKNYEGEGLGGHMETFRTIGQATYVDHDKARQWYRVLKDQGAPVYLDAFEKRMEAEKASSKQEERQAQAAPTPAPKAAQASITDLLLKIEGAEYRPLPGVDPNYSDLWMSFASGWLTVHDYDGEEEQELTETVRLTDFSFEVPHYAAFTKVVPTMEVRVPNGPAKALLSRDGQSITLYPIRVQWGHQNGTHGPVVFKRFIYDTVVLRRVK